MTTIFNPDVGKVEIELYGTHVALLWITFEQLGMFRMFIVTAGDAASWEIASYLTTAKQKKEFILAQLSMTRTGPWSIQYAFHWSDVFEEAVRKALTEKVEALEIHENQLDDWLGLVQLES